MARRNIFRHIKEADTGQSSSERSQTAGYAARGATKNMLASISELAEKAAQATQPVLGEVVSDIDPALIDSSFVNDRLAEDNIAFEELKGAILERGQDTPILVRPHPSEPGRYQTVFGHRRVKVAENLGRNVRAIIRDVSDEEHIIAQGQENSARENLSFIERALFAANLLERGYQRCIIEKALSIDAPMLTRMLSVAGRIDSDLVTRIGTAKSVGRDRWLEFVQLTEVPKCKTVLAPLMETDEFRLATSDQRFEILLSAMKQATRPRRQSTPTPEKARWQSNDKSYAAEVLDNGRSLTVAFKSKDSVRFGRFLAQRLDQLHADFMGEDRKD